MKLGIANFVPSAGCEERYFIAIPRHPVIELGRFKFGFGFCIPIKWTWESWKSNCLFYWSPRPDGFQCRVILVQFGVKRRAK